MISKKPVLTKEQEVWCSLGVDDSDRRYDKNSFES